VTPLSAALAYGRRGWPVFPCQWQGKGRKRPLTPHGLHDATTDAAVIIAWWSRWPDALIGMPTGRASVCVVLDIDVKRDDANGFDSLEDLGHSVLPQTPMAHTATGGLHLHFAVPDGIDIRNTEGAKGRGIGLGLDWRGEGGYVIIPSPGSAYSWDSIWNLETVPLATVPPALLPRERERSASAAPVKPTAGLSPYADAALDHACRNILAAPAGQQEATLNSECFAVGMLAGAGAIPADFARRALIWAARQIPDHDPRRPWRTREIEAKVDRAFADGLRRPREARNA
jgi:putative DNA primase/helicase